MDLDAGRRDRSHKRGLSGLGLLLVAVGVLGLAVAYSALPAGVYRLWPLILVAVGAFGLLRRPGWVTELDLHFGNQVSRAVDRPRRRFSALVLLTGIVCLLLTLQVLSLKALGPVLLIALGLLLVWRRRR